MTAITSNLPADVHADSAAVNRCIEVCIDCQKTFALAAADARGERLKRILQAHSDQRAEFTLQLQRELKKLGAVPENEGSVMGAARQQWMEARHALEALHDDRVIVQACIRAEEAAIDRYLGAAQKSLSGDVRTLLDIQLGAMRHSRTELITLSTQ